VGLSIRSFFADQNPTKTINTKTLNARKEMDMPRHLGFFGTLLVALLLAPISVYAALSEYFVDTQWLEAHQDKVRVVDVRMTPLFLLGHIEGAVNINQQEFLATRNSVPGLIPSVEEFETLMDRFGITPETTVVAYAQDNNPYAARFVWMMRYHGHDQSYVLDGGYEKWRLENRSTQRLPSRVVATSGYKCRQSQDIRSTNDDVLTRMGNPSVIIWDTRSSEEYQGRDVRANRGGHIPGAVHFDWVNLQKEVNGVKVLKSEEEIRELLVQHGITNDHQVIAHCQTGIRSSYATLVLLALGYDNPRNYDGSWIEWANNRTNPVQDSLVASN
jgi:thiosulfate/3-mercaptopyruvate sulfurtransferase